MPKLDSKFSLNEHSLSRSLTVVLSKLMFEYFIVNNKMKIIKIHKKVDNRGSLKWPSHKLVEGLLRLT